MAIWILDAGHGGNDTGIIGSFLGRKESDIVLEAVLEAKKHLERNGEKVVLTRDDNVYLSLEERLDIAEKSSGKFFVSFHMNSDIDSTIKGVQVFYSRDNYDNKRLAKLISEEIICDLGTNEIGILKDENKNFENISAMSVLVCGEYLSNEEVEKEFDSQRFGQIVAKACLAMVDKVLLLTPITEPKETQKRAWRVCVGYYRDYNEAIDAMVDMHKKGFKRAHVIPYDGK